MSHNFYLNLQTDEPANLYCTSHALLSFWNECKKHGEML